MKKQMFLLMVIGITGLQNAIAEQTLVAPQVKSAPVIDGKVDAGIWNQAQELTTRDRVAQLDIHIKAVRAGDEVFFLVRYADKSKNSRHKDFVWDKQDKLYRVGPRREDNLVFKWNMEPFPVDLSLDSEDNYRADIWYWKAARTDPTGHADDKYHIYSKHSEPNAHQLLDKHGRTSYLVRKGDKGEAAYKNVIPIDYQGEVIGGYELHQPSGSRADVRAKGDWQQGIWTIEFARKLDTGYADDVYLQVGRLQQFGLSRYEIAGRVPDNSLEIPLYGSGDISEILWLDIK